jgi:hypothetical protein
MLYDPFGVPAPYGAVVRGDHIETHARRVHPGEELGHQSRIREKNVSEVRSRLVFEDGGVDLVGEALMGGQVHTEGVMGKQEFLLLEIGEHAVGPMQHPRLHEGQGHVAEGDRSAVGDGGDPRREGRRKRGQGFDPHRRGVYLAGPYLLYHLRQTTGMVHLGMVGDDDLDLPGVYY